MRRPPIILVPLALLALAVAANARGACPARWPTPATVPSFATFSKIDGHQALCVGWKRPGCAVLRCGWTVKQPLGKGSA